MRNQLSVSVMDESNIHFSVRVFDSSYRPNIPDQKPPPPEDSRLSQPRYTGPDKVTQTLTVERGM